MSTHRPRFLARLALAAALALAAPAVAQTVEGRLVREEQGLPGIRVVLVDSAGAVLVEGTTDAEGKFTLAAPGPGRYRVRAERAGASAIVSPLLPLAAGQVRPLRLVALGGAVGPVAAAATGEDRAIAVTGVEATARERPRTPMLQGFYDRARRGEGRFVTREQIDRIKPAYFTDILRGLPGVTVVRGTGGEKVFTATSRTMPTGQGGGADPSASVTAAEGGGKGQGLAECPVQFYLDGVYLQIGPTESISTYVAADQVEGVEVYVRSSQVPQQYQRNRFSCGVILIWTRER